jgi:FG-GAP-like repeat
MALRPTPTHARTATTRVALIAALALAGTLLLCGLAAGFGSFTTATTYPTDTNPSAVALADFNHDGGTDIAVSNEDPGGGTVSVVLNQGSGIYGSKVSYPVGNAPYGMVAAELTGDHNIDIAVAVNGDDNVALLKGNGNGTFAIADHFHVDGGPFSIDAADLNHDGRTDLATANPGGNAGGSGSISILLAKQGGFRTARTFPAGPYPYSIQLGRFTGDRKLDAAVIGEYGPVIVYPGNGRGGFGDGLPSFAPHFAGYGYALVAGRFNHDRRLDLAINSCGEEQTVIMLGRRGGRFREGARYTAGYCAYQEAASDLNRDGKLDLLIPDSSNHQVDVLRGKGNGKFTPVNSLTVVGNGRPYAVAAGRLNGDRGPDVAAASNNTATLQVYFNLP